MFEKGKFSPLGLRDVCTKIHRAGTSKGIIEGQKVIFQSKIECLMNSAPNVCKFSTEFLVISVSIVKEIERQSLCKTDHVRAKADLGLIISLSWQPCKKCQTIFF